MRIEVSDKTMKEVLEQGYFSIPRFQRPYSWERSDVEEFWNDLTSNDFDYFIGSVVVYKESSKFGIVDGQQRLTTVTLCLCALRNTFHAHGFSELADGVHGLIERKDIDSKNHYILQPETSYPYFQDVIQKYGEPADFALKAKRENSEEKNLRVAFEILQTRLKQLVQRASVGRADADRRKSIEHQLRLLRDRVLSLKVIFTVLDNEDDAYTIFETLNARGRDLTAADLAKNLFVRLLPMKNAGVDLARDKWHEMTTLFEESELREESDVLSTFLLHFWLSRYEYTTVKKLYKLLKKQVNKSNAKDFLTTLHKESRLYREIREPGVVTWTTDEVPIRDSLNALNLFKVKQQLPAVLAIYREYRDKNLKLKATKEAVRAIESFQFAFSAITSQRSSGGIAEMYSDAAIKLTDAKDLGQRMRVLSELKKELARKAPTYEQFEASFMELRQSEQFTKQSRLIRHILARFQNHYTHAFPIEESSMTIEHLASQNPKNEAKDDPLAPEVVAMMGNLVAISKELNNKLGNKDFLEKKEILKQNGVWMDSVLAQADKLTKEVVYERTRELSKLAYSTVWGLETEGVALGIGASSL